MFRAVLFDFDGVIVQSEPRHLRSFRNLLRPYGVAIPADRWYREFTGIDTTTIFQVLMRDFPSIPGKLEDWVEKRKRYYQTLVLAGKLKATPGVRAFLSRLKRKGIPTAIVSGGHTENIRAVLKRLKLEPFFQTIVALEDVQNRKPHPEGFLKAARRLGVKPEDCIAIEDSPNGLRAARASGAKVVCIQSPASIDVSQCDHAIDDFRQFPKEWWG